MLSDTWPMLIAIIVLIALSAFFSSAETAFTTVNDLKVRVKAEEGDVRAKRVLWILEREAQMLSAILIGNNVVNIAASAVTTAWVYNTFGNKIVAIATGILTIIVLLCGEIIPKSYANAKPLTLTSLYSFPIKWIMILLTPLTYIVRLIQKALLKIVGSAEIDPMTEKELMAYIDTGLKEGAIEDDEFEMISNIVELDKRTARDVMVKRPDITFVPENASYKEIEAAYRKTEHTRYPVLDDEDHVIGTINVKDMLFKDRDEFSIKEIMREPQFTFEHKNIDDLLEEMKEASTNIVIVLDEYGVTSGIITLEDILEEIVGDIRDEYDKDERDDIAVLKPGKEFLVDGSVTLDDVNDETGLDLTSEEYESIGGFMIEALDRLPKKGETIVLPGGTKLIAEIVRYNRVVKVHIIKKEKV